MKSLVWLLIALLSSASAFAAEENDSSSGSERDTAIIQKYLSATKEQQSRLRGMSMEVDIDASVPKLEKSGKLQALRNVSKVGKISYIKRGFFGDKTIEKEVIARFLTAEVQGQTGPDISISPANYKFKYRGFDDVDGREFYVFHLSPRRRQVGLFKGELWIDRQTYLPIRESGRFIKSPSIFLRKMEFVRTYDINNGVAVPHHLESKVDTRLFGAVHLSVNYSNFAKSPQDDSTVAATSGAAAQ